MNFHNWNYSTQSFLPSETNANINKLLKSSNSALSKDFIFWLSTQQTDFLFQFQDFIFTKILEFKHFSLADECLNKKIISFNEKVAKSCAFNISLSFNNEVFDYWNLKVKGLNSHEQSSVYKKFWEEFFSYQFQRNDEVYDNLPNLSYVFNKAPFYIESNFDITNSYLMKSRSSFFESQSLDKDLKFLILKSIAMLCATHYPSSKITFQEEFQKFPEMFEIFDKSLLYEHLNKNLVSKNLSKLSKI